MESKLLNAITYGYNTFIENKGNISEICNEMLLKLLEMTDSGYGFISEYVELPISHLHLHAVTNISWDEKSNKLYNSLKENNLNFYQQDTLLSLIYQQKQLIISNDLYNDTRRGGKSKLPLGHPKLDNFVGIPLYFKNRFIGAIGIANRKNGYTAEFINQFNPFIMTISHIMGGYILELELQEKNKKELEMSKELFKAKSKVWTEISHDIRSPLNEIIGTIGLLRKTSLDLQQSQYAKIISSCSIHLSKFINEILDYSKCSVGKMKLNQDQISIETCVVECYDMIRTQALNKGLDLYIDISDNIPNVVTDKKILKQIINNILSNAVKFTDKGSIRTTSVLTSINKGNCNITFSITDTGIGIKQSDMITIFELYNQVHNKHNKTYEGTGLGLCICKEFIKLFGGDITVKSIPGKGSTFIFNIVVPYFIIKQNNSANNVKVLIVDESKNNRLNYLKIFSKLKIQSQLCSDGEEALEYLKSRGFSILFIDSNNRMGCNNLSTKAKKICASLKTVISSPKIENYSNFDAQLMTPITKNRVYETITEVLS